MNESPVLLSLQGRRSATKAVLCLGLAVEGPPSQNRAISARLGLRGSMTEVRYRRLVQKKFSSNLLEFVNSNEVAGADDLAAKWQMRECHTLPSCLLSSHQNALQPKHWPHMEHA